MFETCFSISSLQIYIICLMQIHTTHMEGDDVYFTKSRISHILYLYHVFVVVIFCICKQDLKPPCVHVVSGLLLTGTFVLILCTPHHQSFEVFLVTHVLLFFFILELSVIVIPNQ